MSGVQFGSMICDPGPCNPGPWLVVTRDMGFLPILVLAAASLMAGYKLSRSNLALPAFCMAAVTAAFYVGFHWKYLMIRHALVGDASYPINVQLSARAWREVLQVYVVAFLTFAIVPLAVGIVAAFIQRRTRKQVHA